MAYVSVPKDLSRVKTKIVMNLTKRQLICFGTAALIGIPVYFLTKDILGNSAAVMVMIVLMLPAFFTAMYEKDGLTAEKTLLNIVRAKWYFPSVRPYQTENFYQVIGQEGELVDQIEKAAPSGKAVTSKRKTSEGTQG